MQIRRATVADGAGLAGLVRQYWQFEGLAGFEQRRISALLEKFLTDPQRGHVWLAEDVGGMQGYLLAVFMFSLEHGGTMAEIDELFVAPQARGAGVGAKLLAAAEQELIAGGIIRLQLQLGVGNHGGRAFYARHGFAERSGYTLLDKSI